MKKFMRILNRIFMVMLMIIIGALIFVALYPGFHIYLVRSESMVPTINMGDLIFARAYDQASEEEIEPGTIVTYQHGKGLITHRVMDVLPDRLVTKGDAMEDPDPWTVTVADVTDIYIFHIPMIGRLITMVGTKLGWLIAIIVPGVILVSLLVKDIIKEAFKD